MGEPQAMQANQTARTGLKIGISLGLLGGSCALLLLNIVSGPVFYQRLFMNNGGQQVDGTIPGPWLIVPILALVLAAGVVAGIGNGLVIPASIDRVVGGGDPELAGVTAGLNETSIEIGASIGVAALGAIQRLVFASRLPDGAATESVDRALLDVDPDTVFAAFRAGSQAGLVAAAVAAVIAVPIANAIAIAIAILLFIAILLVVVISIHIIIANLIFIIAIVFHFI